MSDKELIRLVVKDELSRADVKLDEQSKDLLHNVSSEINSVRKHISILSTAMAVTNTKMENFKELCDTCKINIKEYQDEFKNVRDEQITNTGFRRDFKKHATLIYSALIGLTCSLIVVYATSNG